MKHKIIKAISHILSIIIPRNKNVWVFGGNRGLRFADNSRYMFIYSSKYTDKKCVWLSQDWNLVKEIRGMGYTSYLSKEPLGLYYGFNAKWHIFDVSIADTSVHSSIGAYQFNLWHGMPIKNISNLIKSTGKTDKKHFFSFGNKEFQRTILNSFDIDKNNIVVSNQPRNTVFYINEKEKEHYVMSVEKETLNQIKSKKNKGNKILGYFPTWRDTDSENFLGVDNIEELSELNDLLIENKAYILTKRHTCSFKEYKHHGYSKRSEINEKNLLPFSNIITMGFEIDLNAVITECDMLISDYSSVIIDYLIINKPIILYTYDLKQFQKAHNLFYDYNEFRFGHQAFSMQELIQILKEYFKDDLLFLDQYSKYRLHLKNRFFTYDECFEPVLKVLEKTDEYE